MNTAAPKPKVYLLVGFKDLGEGKGVMLKVSQMGDSTLGLSFLP